MFVNVVEFPPVAEGRDADFRAWFEWSNGVYAGFDGFVSRRRLEDTKVPGRYAAMVEPLLTGSPTPYFYTVVSTSAGHVSSPAA